MGMAPLTMAIFLVLLVGVDGVGRDDGLIPVIMSHGKQRSMGGRDASLRDLILETLGDRGSPPKDVPPDFFCHSCQEFSRKAENFLADPSLYDEASNLSTEVCQIMHSELQTKCRRLVELYLHEGILFLQIIFGEKNLCNGTGFCAMDAGSTLSLMSTPRGHRGRFPSMEPNFVPLGKQLLAQQQSKVLSRWTQHSPLKARIRSRSCNACHSATDQILKELEDHDQQMAIMRALLGVCEGFKTYAARCKVWVFEYGPLFLANLHKFLSSEDVCHLIHMCAEPAPPKREAAGHLHLRRGTQYAFPTASTSSLGQ